MMLVRDHMTRRPVTLQVDSDYKIALKLMQDYAIHHLPVVDARQRLAGIVAERDLLLAAYHYLGSAVDIGEVMHDEVVTAAPDMRVTDAALLMVNHTIGALPVLDRSGGLVGIITETDIFQAFVEMSKKKPSSTAEMTPSKGAGTQRRAKKTSRKSRAVKSVARKAPAGKVRRRAKRS